MSKKIADRQCQPGKVSPARPALSRGCSFICTLAEKLRQHLYRFKKQIYCRREHIGMARELPSYIYRPACRIEFTLQLASQKHIFEALYRAENEKCKSIDKIIRQKWFDEPGSRRCYVALTKDTKDLCCMQWVVLPHDRKKPASVSSQQFDELKRDECLLDTSYTFDKYKGSGVMPSALLKICELAGMTGFKRIKTHISTDNLEYLLDCQKAGFQDFEKRIETTILFHTHRTILKIRPPKHPVNIIYQSKNGIRLK